MCSPSVDGLVTKSYYQSQNLIGSPHCCLYFDNYDSKIEFSISCNFCIFSFLTKKTISWTIFMEHLCRARYNVPFPVAAKPIKIMEVHYY